MCDVCKPYKPSSVCNETVEKNQTHIIYTELIRLVYIILASKGKAKITQFKQCVGCNRYPRGKRITAFRYRKVQKIEDRDVKINRCAHLKQLADSKEDMHAVRDNYQTK